MAYCKLHGDRHVLMWKSLEILNVFSTFILKQKTKKQKTKTFLKNLEYRFLVESTKIENAKV